MLNYFETTVKNQAYGHKVVKNRLNLEKFYQPVRNYLSSTV
jgi:hypothetical protein